MKTKMKVRVAIFHCGFIYSGGGERIVLEEARGLADHGFEVEVYGPTLDKKLCFPQEVERLNVKTFLPQLPPFIPGRHALLMVFSCLFAPLFAFKFKEIDLFLGANQPGAWIAYCVAKVLRKPYIVYLNQPNRLLYSRKIDEEVHWQNLKEYYFIDNLIKKLKFFVAWADHASSTGGRALLVNGGHIGSIIKKTYKNEDTIFCPAGSYVANYKNLRLNPHTAYSGKFKIKNVNGEIFEITKPYILITNRHVPQKKFEVGIETFKTVREKYPNIKLVIPGPFTEYSDTLVALSKRINLYQDIIFTRQIPEDALQRLYQEAAVYIYTAPEEDFGMGVIEAMGWGVPVVAWNHAGPTVTVVDGKTGYLAKPYEIEDFAQKIILVLEDSKRRSEIGKNAWEHVKKNFTWQKHVDILETTIRKAIS